MRSVFLTEIEDRLPKLSREERLELIETVVHSLREPAKDDQRAWDADLRAMAADPQIIREIEGVDREFAGTLLDGLGAA